MNLKAERQMLPEAKDVSDVQRVDSKNATKCATKNVDKRYTIDLVAVSKQFARRSTSRGAYTTLKTFFVGGWRNFWTGVLWNVREDRSDGTLDSRSKRDLWALKDLTLRIPRGAAVGIIGRNGSGKSTLLKLISGIYQPSQGTIAVNGSIAALIELGAGFHPDFTGRENVFLAGVMHGLTRKQILARFDEIVRFAELEHVIDEPVRTYSSGMFMRLGFSVAVHTNPDILIVDEVLAVGDAAFVVKCQERLAELRRSGKTLLLVTHDLEAVQRWCDEAVWLEAGVVKDRGEPRRVIDAYRQFIAKGEEQQLLAKNKSLESESEAVSVPSEPSRSEVEVPHPVTLDSDLAPERWGSREVEIIHVELLSADGLECAVFHPDSSLLIKIQIVRHEAIRDFVCGIAISRTDGTLVTGTNTHIDGVELDAELSEGVIEVLIPRLGLNEGSFTLDVALHAQDGYPYDYQRRRCRFAVRSSSGRVGLVDLSVQWFFNGTGSQFVKGAALANATGSS